MTLITYCNTMNITVGLVSYHEKIYLKFSKEVYI